MIKEKCIHCGKEIDEGTMCDECKEEDSKEKERKYIG